MDFPQQHHVLFPGNPSRVADAPRSATGFPAPQPHTRSAPSSGSRRPFQGYPHGNAGVSPVSDAVFPPVNAAGNHRANEDREVVPQPVEDFAARVQPRDLQYIDMGHYGMVGDYPPPQGHREHIIGNNARIVQDVPAQVHVAPPVPGIDQFNIGVLQAAAGPAPAFLDEFPHEDPVPNRRASEVLRQLAILYLQDPNSRVTVINMQPSHADEVTVVIALKLTDI